MSIIEKITKETTIGDVIRQKGKAAGEMMDEFLCDNEERICCPGTTVTLEHAAHLKDKLIKLGPFIAELNKLKDQKS